MAKYAEKDSSEHGAGDVHARLIDAAGELLVERGYRGATTREIAQRAGVTEMTLFRHFTSKEALMRRGIEMNCEGFAAMVPQPTGDLAGDLLTLLEQYRLMWESRMEKTLELLPECRAIPRCRKRAYPRAFNATANASSPSSAITSRPVCCARSPPKKPPSPSLAPSSSASFLAKPMVSNMPSIRKNMYSGTCTGE